MRDVGGIHHLAWRVSSVEETMDKFRRYKMAQFTTDRPIECPGLVQVFTTEHNVKRLMESSAPKDKADK